MRFGKSLLFSGTAALASVIMYGCGGGSSSSSSSSAATGVTSEAYPTSLAVASPFKTTSESLSSGVSLANGAGVTYISSYSWMKSKITTLLGSSSSASCSASFQPQAFLSLAGRADCYGPTLKYSDHPDGTTPNSGDLPSGDLGLWIETTASTGEACAATELNAQMDGVSGQAYAAMTSVAAMICTANANGIWPPAAGSTINLLSGTLASPMSAPNVTFSTATISRDSTGNVWTYTLYFDYTDMSAVVHPIKVQLSHENGSTPKGRFTYLVNNTFSGGNCPSANVTLNGSLVYSVNSSTSIDMQSRTAAFCGHNSSGIDSAGLVDPAYSYPTYSTGWGNNFSVFTASFDPSTQAGSYSYRWQAGPGDSNTRVFNIKVNNNSPIDGEAWFGYGKPITSTDECIEGFFCNWAGPGTTHVKTSYAQRQHVTMDSASGVVKPTNAAASDITYAPTNSCTYDGSSTFKYDRDLDTLLSDETAATNVVTSPLTTGLLFDLYAAQDTDGDGTPTMCETIKSRGYTDPTKPAYSNAYTGPTHP